MIGRAFTLLAITIGSVTAAEGQAPTFPAAWVGTWSGTLTTISPPDSVRNRIPITLEIAPQPGTGHYAWTTVFNADTVRGLRPYRLLVENAAKGLFATDEGNGVLLDETYVGGVLTSVFKVQSRVLESRYTLRGDTLTHELTWWDEKPSRTVKGQGANSEGGAEIQSYRVQGMQRSVFSRRP